MDDNCDGNIDEGVPTVTGYLDSDGDGYGVEGEEVPPEQCVGLDGYVPARGDCADNVPTRYPGAKDFPGDGIDGDCGGTDDADPHVGLTATSLPTLQAALVAAADGQVVWVGPGTYLEHELTMSGKAIALRSTRGENATVIDGKRAGTVILFVDGEGAGSVLDGFTIVEGVASYNCLSGGYCGNFGGGMFLSYSSPSLTHVTLSGNTASNDGGGMGLFYSISSLTHVTLSGNTASNNGGGMFLNDASSTITNSIIAYNSGSYNVDAYSSSSSTFTYSALYDSNGNNLYGLTLDSTNLISEPGFSSHPPGMKTAACGSSPTSTSA